MELEEILQALEKDTGKFPREALQQAIEQREAITPHLLDALRFVRANLDELPEGYFLHTWAMYLLAQFRETQAYPLIINLLDLPSAKLDELHGDILTEDMSRILASVCGGDTRLMERLAESPQVDEYARDAALDALVCLVALGQRSREETLEYFRHLFQTAQAEPTSYFWTGLVSNALHLYPDTLREEIQGAFDQELVDLVFLDEADVKAVFAQDKEKVLAGLADSTRMRLIEDTVRETAWWANFASSSVLAAAAPQAGRVKPAPTGPKPGRNAPCPCGSGLKYKKCCLKNAA